VPEDRANLAVRAELTRLLREAREGRGLSMNMLATQSGLSQSFISMFESGPSNPTIDTLLRIAKVLELDAGEVLSEAIARAGAGRPKPRAGRRR
jgi:transcriptional regulator with XRE-family HTH domain